MNLTERQLQEAVQRNRDAERDRAAWAAAGWVCFGFLLGLAVATLARA